MRTDRYYKCGCGKIYNNVNEAFRHEEKCKEKMVIKLRGVI